MMESDNNLTYLDSQTLDLLDRDENKYIDVSKKVAKDIQMKKLTILDVVKKLGCLLLNQSFVKRELGVLILSESLNNLGNGVLNPEEIAVLSSYFAEKLKDHHQVATSALKGVLALVRLSNISDDSIVQLLTNIFNHITCQQQQQSDRYLIFRIFETILTHCLSAIESMGIDFVYGVMSSIDGERDPKNLIYLFNWLPRFLNTVKLQHLTEEMFEVLSCYFPVDFKAPPSDKNNITREELAEGLCKCLTCLPDFGQYGIPLALEKLDSALKIAKEDSLDLLKEGCTNYPTETYNQHSIEIWSQIQKEIFNTTDAELKLRSLKTLEAFINKLSHGDPKNFENTVLDIADTLRGNVLPDSKLFPQSYDMLLYIARASETSSILVAKKVVPLLENTFKITNSPKEKAVILHSIVEFVRACIETNPHTELIGIEEITNCPLLCFQAIREKDPNLIIEGHKGFTALVQFIPNNIRQAYLQHLHHDIVSHLDSEVSEAVVKSLEKFAEIVPEEVEINALHKAVIGDVGSVDTYLEGLSSLVKLPYFEEYVIDTYIIYAVSDIESSAVALRHLHSLLSKYEPAAKALIKKNFIVKLIEFAASLESPKAVTKSFLSALYSVLQRILQNQDVPVQREVYLAHSNRNFQNHGIHLAVLGGLTIPLHREVPQDYDKIEFFLDSSSNDSEEFLRTIALETLANVLNKLSNDMILEDKLNAIKAACDSSEKETKVWLISWVIKSLVTRNHPKAWQWTDLLLSCFKANSDIAKSLKIITDDSGVISKENHCNIMPLYKQKFFVYCTNKLCEIKEDGINHLNALGYLLENVPRQAILGHFKKISQSVLLCLEKSEEPEVLLIILQRITEFINSNEAAIEDNLEDVLVRVLNLTTFEASMKVRLAAIHCLYQITISYKTYKLLPYKQRVVQQLGMCVDDKKRLVRKDAMGCRSLWYLLDAPI